MIFAPLMFAAAAGLSAYTSLQQGRAAKSAASYNNALALDEARNLELETRESITRERQRQREAIATMRASVARSGVRSDTGSTLQMFGETAARFQTTVADAARAASIQANTIRAKGSMGIWEGRQAGSAARLSALGTMLDGAGKIAFLKR